MTVLVFKDRGWDIVTSSWSAGSKKPGKTILCYMWGADGISWSDSATGTAQITLDLDIADFLKLVARSGGVVDLRG